MMLRSERYLYGERLVEAFEGGSSVDLGGVHFDFSSTASLLVRLSGKMDPWPLLELVDSSRVNSACIWMATESVAPEGRIRGDQLPCFHFPWFQGLAAQEMDIAARYEARVLKERSLREPQSTLGERFWQYFDELVRVQQGDTVRSSPRFEKLMTTDPFAHPADKLRAAATLELWRGGEFVCAAVAPIIVQSSDSFAAGASFLRTLEARIKSRSRVTPPARGRVPAIGIRGSPQASQSLTEWDHLALQLFEAFEHHDHLTKEVFDAGLRSPVLRSQHRMRSVLRLVFEDGARLGWAAKEAEASELMRPEALRHHQRRKAGKQGAEITARKKAESAAASKRMAQELADSLWQRHPNWSKAAVARKIAKKVGRSESSVRQSLKKPAKERS